MPNGWRTINSLVHKIRLHGRRGKGMAESFSRQKSRHAPQKEGGLKILCDLPPVWPRLVRPTNLMSRMDGKKTHTHTHTKFDFTVDDGKEWLNSSREKNYGTHRRRKVNEKSCVTFLLCDPGWYVQRTWCPEWMGRKRSTKELIVLHLLGIFFFYFFFVRPFLTLAFFPIGNCLFPIEHFSAEDFRSACLTPGQLFCWSFEHTPTLITTPLTMLVSLSLPFLNLYLFMWFQHQQ